MTDEETRSDPSAFYGVTGSKGFGERLSPPPTPPFYPAREETTRETFHPDPETYAAPHGYAHACETPGHAASQAAAGLDGSWIPSQEEASFPWMDDRRVANSTDNTLRHEYRDPGDVEKQQVRALKDKGQELLFLLDMLVEINLARNNLEKAVMWAVKHVTK